MNNFQRNIYRTVTNDIPDIYCYTIGIVSSFVNQECLGNPITTSLDTLTLTIFDINGNPVTATQNYTFNLLFREKTCLSPEAEVERQYTITTGNSSVSGTYSRDTYVDCGQGNCENEYQEYLSVASVPVELQDIINCPT